MNFKLFCLIAIVRNKIYRFIGCFLFLFVLKKIYSLEMFHYYFLKIIQKNNLLL